MAERRAIVKNESNAEKLRSIKEIEKKKKEILDIFDSFTEPDKLDMLKKLGVANKYYTCQSCDDVKIKKDFYVSTEPNCKSGITKICKQCAKEIAMPIIDGIEQQPTKQSVDDAMYALNKPILESVWEASLLEAANTATGKAKNNVYTSYCKNIQMQNYYTLTYRESDGYTGGMFSLDDIESKTENTKDQEIIEQFEQNKKDTLRLLGYLPFENEKLSGQPFLYSQLIGFLDSSEDANEDRMRTSSIIEIVKGFYHIEKINDVIALKLSDIKNIEKNTATIKSLEDTKNKITTSILNLAKDNGISLKHSVNASKGENTWTGKVKKMKDINLREAETNIYDVEYSEGLKQVAEISDAAIIKQIRLDENDYNDMIIQQRELISKYKNNSDRFEEQARILLRENYDLKDLLKKNNINIGEYNE